MRIPAISNYYIVRNNNKNVTAPSFQKIKKDVKLSNKISQLIPLSENGDVITIGKNFETVVDGLKNTLSAYTGIIKRILHIKAAVSVPMAISIDEDGDFQCVNIGDKTFALVKDLKNSILPQKHFAVDPLNLISIEQGDIIVNGKR